MEEEEQIDIGDNFSDIDSISEKSQLGTISIEDSSWSSAENGREILKKCIRKGDKICYSKLENINMIQNAKKDGNSQPSFKPTVHADKVSSGESLYKAFTFQQGSNDEETEKCIAFWKTVVAKNLAPLKCTIIENRKNKEKSEIKKKESTIVSENETFKNDASKIHDDYKNMWVTLINELQRKRLHEIKLIGKSRCKICDSVLQENLDKISKSEVEREIVELNKWDPASKKKGKPTYKSKLSKYGTFIKQSVKDSNRMKPHDTVKEDTNIYKHIDVIQEKKNSGAYSAWRSNKVESLCPCEYPDCDCNINPAIATVEIPYESKLKEREHTISRKPTEQSISIKQNSNEFLEHNGVQKRKSMFKSYSSNRLKKTLSVMLSCQCSSEDCDCEIQKEVITKIPVPVNDNYEKPKLPGRKSVAIVSSLELLHKKLHSPDSIGFNDETDKIETVVYQNDSYNKEYGTKDDDKKGNEETSAIKKCLCSSEDCDCNKEQERTEETVMEKCVCSDPICDCEKKQDVSKIPFDSYEIHKPHERNGYDDIEEVEKNIIDL